MFSTHKFFSSRMVERRPSVVFVQHPVSRVISGSSTTFSVSVQTVPPGLPVTYQWYRLERGQGSAIAIPGETAATLNLVGLSQGGNDGDFYRVEVRPAWSTLTRPVSYSSAAASLHFAGSSLLSGVYACGLNGTSLGDSSNSDRHWLVRILAGNIPQFNGGISKVSMGSRHGFVIAGNGELWGWGSDGWSVGTGGLSVNTSPVRIGLDTWLDVAAGGDHSLAIKSDGTLWGWGNREGSADDGRAPKSGVPQLIDSGSWSKVSAGGRGGIVSSFGHSMAIKSDGTLWAWGNNTYGQLGLGDVINRSVLTQVASGTGWTWTDVSAGYLSTMAIRNDGRLWGWGWDAGQEVSRTSIVGLDSMGETYSKISVGASWSVGIKSNGTLWSAFGLGSGSGVWQFMGFSADRWLDVAAGFGARYAIRNDGTLWSWGRQDHGELSNAELTGEYSPSGGGFYDYGLLDVDQPTMIDSGVWSKLSAGDYNFVATRSPTE